MERKYVEPELQVRIDGLEGRRSSPTLLFDFTFVAAPIRNRRASSQEPLGLVLHTIGFGGFWNWTRALWDEDGAIMCRYLFIKPASNSGGAVCAHVFAVVVAFSSVDLALSAILN